MELIENLVNEQVVTFDENVEYKGLTFYPAKVKDAFKFQFGIQCLLLDQFNDEDINENFAILQMPYLDYLFYFDEKQKNKGIQSYIVIMLLALFSVVLDDDFFQDDNPIGLYVDEKNHYFLRIHDIDITHEDFNIIRQIICVQNNVDLSMFDLDPSVRKNLQETLRLKNQGQNESCSLEDKMLLVMINTSLPLKDIQELSIRKFNKILDRIDLQMHYEIYTLASKSGFVEFKEPYPHWLSKIDNDISKNVTSYDATKKKINMANSDFDI